MTPLHRHQLVRLNASGWQAVRAQAGAGEGGAGEGGLQTCLALWQERDLPLVVGRQCGSTLASAGGALCLGLAAPASWQRQRLSMRIERSHIGWFDEFPLAARIDPLLPRPMRASWSRLCRQLHREGTVARVYGSHGWQAVTGLPYLHPRSDIDLWITVQDAVQADGIAALLDQAAAGPLPRLDGELCFPDGRAVAWREWRPWRSGAARQVLVKTLTEVRLLDRWPADAPAAPREPVAA